MTIHDAHTAADLAEARALIESYAAALGVDLCFQDFDAELDALDTVYGPPRGALLLAKDGAGRAVGVVALRPAREEGVCEMKRLFVRPDARGQGHGRVLAEAIVARAEALGYQSMRLDTLDTMVSARALYRTLGFAERTAYYANPLPGVVYMERRLTPHPQPAP